MTAPSSVFLNTFYLEILKSIFSHGQRLPSVLFLEEAFSPRASWKETEVSSADRAHPNVCSQNHSELLKCTKTSVEIPAFYNLEHGRDEFSLEISILPIESDFDEHWLFHQEDLAASDLISLLHGGLYQTLELWVKSFKYNCHFIVDSRK